MPSLDDTFSKLRNRLKEGTGLRETGDDPVYYLIFDPEKMLDVKRSLKKWRSRLELDGWGVYTLSMADAVHTALQNHPLRDFWLEEEQRDPFDFESINGTLSQALASQKALDEQILEQQDELRTVNNALLLITDLEAIHPYTRIGAIESRLQGEFDVPTVIFYPGKRNGEYTLSFLGIYPEDGNYRSVHIGG
jgi:phytoene dehydrogenase-like protein